MKLSIALLACVCAFVMAAPPREHYDVEKAPEYFEKFIKDYNRVYKDDEDRQVHFEAFKNNLETINRQNERPGETATFGINQFADYTAEEKKSLLGFGN